MDRLSSSFHHRNQSLNACKHADREKSANLLNITNGTSSIPILSEMRSADAISDQRILSRSSGSSNIHQICCQWSHRKLGIQTQSSLWHVLDHGLMESRKVEASVRYKMCQQDQELARFESSWRRRNSLVPPGLSTATRSTELPSRDLLSYSTSNNPTLVHQRSRISSEYRSQNGCIVRNTLGTCLSEATDLETLRQDLIRLRRRQSLSYSSIRKQLMNIYQDLVQLRGEAHAPTKCPHDGRIPSKSDTFSNLAYLEN